MSNQEESPSILKALADLKEGHHPLAMSILAEMEIMRQVETHLSQTTDKIDDKALHDLHKTISDDVVSAVHEVVSTGGIEASPGPAVSSPGAAASGHVMRPGQVLYLRDQLSSEGGEYTFKFSSLWNLALYENPGQRVLWECGTTRTDVSYCILEETGNLVIYNRAHRPVWMTGTWQHPGSELVVEHDGSVFIRRPDGIRVWETNALLGSLKIFHASGSTAANPETTLTVPDGYKILCGGARVNWSEPGNLLTASFPRDTRTWVAKAKDHMQPSPANIDVWATAIYDPANNCDVDIFSERQPEFAGDQFPSAYAYVPVDYVLTGGGAQAHWQTQGSLLRASCPRGSRSWFASSGAHIAAEKAFITAYAIGIRAAYYGHSDSVKTMFERKMFETRIFANMGTPARCPSAEISTAGGYVLVGGGATVNYPAEEGIFLTASYPERDTWKAASKYHILENENPHTITAYAIGARVGSGKPG